MIDGNRQSASADLAGPVGVLPLRLDGGPVDAGVGIGHYGQMLGDVEGEPVQVQMSIPNSVQAAAAERIASTRAGTSGTPRVCRTTTLQGRAAAS